MSTNDEIQIGLDELETRLDRLRALYEQYFTGIEKAVPAVQHKDVERRIQAFRKMHLRNTAQRFRLQTLIQKYTTYLQYWQRILRRIEEGTHKRDLARAMRYGVKAKDPRAQEVYELDDSALEAVDEEPGGEFDRDEPTQERAPFAKPAPAPTPATSAQRTGAAVPAPAVVQPSRPAVVQPTRQVEVMPFDVVEAPPRAASVPAPASVPAAAPVQSVPAPASAPASAHPAVKRPGLSVFGVAQKPAGATTASAQPLPKPAVATPAVPVPAVPAPAVPAPAVARPAVATRPAVPSPAAPAPARPAASAAPTSGTDAALRQLYERYREARKKNGEADVDFDVVARQVRDTIPKLREKYPGAQVDLDVAEKDGRTILRPVVKAKK